jgi:hypothetical protein
MTEDPGADRASTDEEVTAQNDGGTAEFAIAVAALDNEPETPEEQVAAAEIATMPVEGSLIAVLRSLAGDDPTVTLVEVGGATEFQFRGVGFARVDPERASFRLRREIVSAAIRTGGAATSPLGADWVILKPVHWDRYAHDRAVSWWHLGLRLAAESGTAKGTGRT